MSPELTYTPAGATCPGDPVWAGQAPGLRRFEQTIEIGHGAALWESVADDVLRWGIKRRSGFRVTPTADADERVAPGAEYRVTAGWGPIAVHEPVRVVEVVDTLDRCGFAYGTLPGHPVSGEEAFVVHRDAHGTIFLTLRSLTQPAPKGLWRTIFPLLMVAQRFYRRRYLRCLVR